MTDEMTVSAGLETLARGEIIEQVDRLLDKAIESMVDPNTDPKAARTVTLKIVLKGSEKRETANVTYAVDLKVPTDATGEDHVFIRRKDARGFVVKGEQLDLETKIEGNVTELDTKKENG
jgi:hypothetical protein